MNHDDINYFENLHKNNQSLEEHMVMQWLNLNWKCFRPTICILWIYPKFMVSSGPFLYIVA